MVADATEWNTFYRDQLVVAVRVEVLPLDASSVARLALR